MDFTGATLKFYDDEWDGEPEAPDGEDDTTRDDVAEVYSTDNDNDADDDT